MISVSFTLGDLLHVLSFVGGFVSWVLLEKYLIRKLYKRISDPNEPIRRNARCTPPNDLTGPNIVWSPEHQRYMTRSEYNTLHNVEQEPVDIKPKKKSIRHNFTGLPWE